MLGGSKGATDEDFDDMQSDHSSIPIVSRIFPEKVMIL